jgi:aspartate/methionine/tyrosine aminotransferase
MTTLDNMSLDAIKVMARSLEQELELQRGNRLSLDLTRGKPSAAQLDLSAGLDDPISGNYTAADGTDTRNYGQLRGIPEARAIGAELMDVEVEEVICWGNSSLALMYLTAEQAVERGLWGDDRAWRNTPDAKVLTPVPGYDRHFTLTERLGLEMVNVDLTDTGPDLEQIQAAVADDASVKAIWCVPKYSNPTGCIYSDATVDAIAELPKVAAADDFVVFWDNAYAVHDFEFPRAPLKPLLSAARAAGTEDQMVLFASTSKITYASGGISFVASSSRVLDIIEDRLSVASVGPDKVSQLRHARFLGGRIEEHMAQHAELMRPKFELVEKVLAEELGELDIASWTTPAGGYFVSLDTRPGLARAVGELAAEVGLAITPPGATFPYGNDPEDRNLRIAPSFATLEDLKAAMQILVICVKLATLRDEMQKRG